GLPGCPACFIWIQVPYGVRTNGSQLMTLGGLPAGIHLTFRYPASAPIHATQTSKRSWKGLRIYVSEIVWQMSRRHSHLICMEVTGRIMQILLCRLRDIPQRLLMILQSRTAMS